MAAASHNNNNDNNNNNNNNRNDTDVDDTDYAKYNSMRKSKEESVTGYFKIPKAWMHTLGALIISNIIVVVVASISLYVDVQLLKARSIDQMKAISRLQDIVLYGKQPSRFQHTNPDIESE